MKKLLLPVLAIIALSSWYQPKSLKGTYEYAGGISNGRREQGPTEYTLQRRYDDAHFSAYLLEPKQPQYKYQSGNYALRVDTCLETETFSAQASKLTNITLRYSYQFHKDTLVLSGMLPSGKVVQEFWKKVK